MLKYVAIHYYWPSINHTGCLEDFKQDDETEVKIMECVEVTSIYMDRMEGIF